MRSGFADGFSGCNKDPTKDRSPLIDPADNGQDMGAILGNTATMQRDIDAIDGTTGAWWRRAVGTTPGNIWRLRKSCCCSFNTISDRYTDSV